MKKEEKIAKKITIGEERKIDMTEEAGKDHVFESPKNRKYQRRSHLAGSYKKGRKNYMRWM